MTSWTAISPAEHADSRWLPRKDFAFAANKQLVEIFVGELKTVLHYYAVGFVKQDEAYQLVALVGVEKDRSLYVDLNNEWTCEYVPASLRGYPFMLADSERQEDEKVLCIDQDYLTDDSDAVRLFKADGEQDDSITETLNFFVKCDQDRRTTQAACQALADAGVIEAWPLNVARGDDENSLSIEGFYCINEAKLNSLDTAVFAGLRETGAFHLAYAQLFSMNQLTQLSRRSEYLATQQQQIGTDQEVTGASQEE